MPPRIGRDDVFFRWVRSAVLENIFRDFFRPIRFRLGIFCLLVVQLVFSNTLVGFLGVSRISCHSAHLQQEGFVCTPLPGHEKGG